MEARMIAAQGDITRQQVDAIVNAANSALRAGGGVCGAIHDAAGPELEQTCLALSGCPTGDAKITPGFRLPARWVIHTVGPIWQDGEHQEDALLASCYQKSLALAEQHDIHTLAFPAISTGIFGFPLERATAIAVSETRRFLDGHALPEQVIFMCFSERAYQVYLNAMQHLSGE
ncbi:MAG TPA: O-acetyl-ADP-ribose deacetylase [Ktedonobacterales bacterium]|jgi:O-acetyl-ADP-ribose deacetylase (regulator of RNase III)